MSDNLPLKIRTMADDLEKAEKKEAGSVFPVSSAPVSPNVSKKFPPQPADSKPDSEKEERKSLKDVLIQLGESEKSSELPKEKIKRTKGKIEVKIESENKSDLENLLGRMKGAAQESPPPGSQILTPSRPSQKESDLEVQKEVQEEIKNAMSENTITEDTITDGATNRVSAEKSNLARDKEEEKEKILKIEKELEEKNKEIEKAEKKPPLAHPLQGGEKAAAEEEKMKESGITGSAEKLKPKSSRDALKEIEEAADKTKGDFEAPHLSPGARLLYNKPEYYSSVLNKVKEKREDTEISKIKKTFKDQEPPKKEEKKDPDKEYKRFKKSFKGGQRARLAEKMSKRMVLTLAGIVIIGVVSVLIWFLAIKKPSEDQSPYSLPKTAVEEIEEFCLIEDEIIIEMEDDGAGLIAKINAQAARLERERKIADISRITVQKDDAPVSLEELLKELKIEMPSEVSNLFSDNKYSLLLFKENYGVKRLGLALAIDNPSTARLKFQSWENENIASRKMQRAFESLFLGSRVSSAPQGEFKTGEYLGVKMRYIQVPDKNTSLDYLIYGDILVVTTSKGSIFQVIEILIAS